MRQIILDTETTGFSSEEGHRIIEIGAIEMVNRKLTGKNFHCYLHPDREIDPGAQNIHGITLDFLKNKPRFHEISDDFLTFIKDAELIIHNAVFDRAFINNEFKRCQPLVSNIDTFCKITCTLILARNLHPGQKNSLDALCKRYNVDNSRRDLHGALLDANLLSHVYLAMTGGQKSLFSEEIAAFNTGSSSDFTFNINRPSLNVIRASSEEMAQHLLRLSEIQQLAE